MRLAVSTLLTLLLVATAQVAGEGKPGKPDPHVRPLQEEGKRLFEVGMTSSPTFQRLVTRLEHSDVIVYVDVTVDVPPHFVGVLRFLTMTKSSRFLVVRLNLLAPGAALVGILGHELQHSVEVADAKDVTSAEGPRAALSKNRRRHSLDRGCTTLKPRAKPDTRFATRRRIGLARCVSQTTTRDTENSKTREVIAARSTRATGKNCRRSGTSSSPRRLPSVVRNTGEALRVG
jgi:hypothetical protein